MIVTNRSAGHRRRFILLLLSFLIILGAVGCATQQPTVRTFVLEDGTQYFLRPVEFQGDQGTALLDVTVRITDAGESTSVNFSLPVDIASVTRPNRVDEAAFLTSSGDEYPLAELRLLYVDAAVLRYESTVAFSDLEALVAAAHDREETITFRAIRGGRLEEFEAGERFYEGMRRLAISIE